MRREAQDGCEGGLFGRTCGRIKKRRAAVCEKHPHYYYYNSKRSITIQHIILLAAAEWRRAEGSWPLVVSVQSRGEGVAAV